MMHRYQGKPHQNAPPWTLFTSHNDFQWRAERARAQLALTRAPWPSLPLALRSGRANAGRLARKADFGGR
jgi:hypothetical protein